MDQNLFNSLDEFLRICNRKIDSMTPQQFQIYLQQLTQLLSSSNIQIEAKNNCFFKRWNEIKVPLCIIDLNFISYLLVLYTKVNESLKEDILLDYIWPIILYEFDDKQIVVEYFNIMKVIYNRNVREQLKYFGFLDIVKYMLKTTEFDGMICCEQHNKDQKLQLLSAETAIKIDQFGLLIQTIFTNIAQELKSSSGNNLAELESLFGISIHQLLSYCTKDHYPCQVQTLQIVILSQIIEARTETVVKVFSNFEAVSFAVLLFNCSEYYMLKVYCIKIFQAITEKNKQFLQKLILSLIPPSKNKNIDWLGYEPLICSILEWALALPISLRVAEYQMFDEKLIFKNGEVLELLLSYVYICPDMMKQQLVATIYTLVRNNKENQTFFMRHKHFLSTFPKFLISQQDFILLNDQQINSLQKSVFDTSLKLMANIFICQMNNGKVDLLFQWQKLAQLEAMKQKNEDQDGCKDLRTPQYLLRQLLNYIFQSLQKSSILNCSELQNELMWKGFQLFMTSFLALLSKDLIQQDQLLFHNLGKAIYSPQMFFFKRNNYQQIQIMKSNEDGWIDYQFLNKIVLIINFLYSQTLQMNLDIIKPSINFKTNDFTLWLNLMFKKIVGNEKDNICLLRIIQTLVAYYSHYIITLHFGQEQLDEAIQLIKAYRHLMQVIICGGQQLKNLKNIAVDIEFFIIQSHYYYIESTMKLVDQIRKKCSKDHRSSHDAFFNLIEEKYTLQELITSIQFQLSEYYLSCVKLCSIYGKRTQNYLWTFCYEIIRMKKSEGEILESYLQTLINQPDIISEIVISKEMVNYYCNCPNMIIQKQKSQLKMQELIRWADLLVQQQEHEQIVQYQEQYSRQSQILMKDVTKTLNKYNLIQLQNYEIFESEKLKYDQSKTL